MTDNHQFEGQSLLSFLGAKCKVDDHGLLDGQTIPTSIMCFNSFLDDFSFSGDVRRYFENTVGRVVVMCCVTLLVKHGSFSRILCSSGLLLSTCWKCG